MPPKKHGRPDKFTVGTDPLAKRFKPTIPIHRGIVKLKWLTKHASLLRRPDTVSGMLVSCGVGAETRALSQVRNFLDWYLPVLFPAHQAVWERFEGELDVDESFIPQESAAVNPKETEPNEKEDITIEGEPKSEGKAGNARKDRKFQAVDAACGGLVFFRFRVNVTPVEFMCKVLEHVSKLSKEEHVKEFKKINYCARFIPLDYFCAVTLEDIQTTARHAVELKFPFPTAASSTNPEDLPKPTVAIVIEIRNNQTIKKEDILKTVADFIPSHCKVQLTNPEFVILVSVFKSVCGLSIIPDYYKYRKYNMSIILNDVEE